MRCRILLLNVVAGAETPRRKWQLSGCSEYRHPCEMLAPCTYEKRSLQSCQVTRCVQVGGDGSP